MENDDNQPPSEEGSGGGLLGQIAAFKRGKLKPTETVHSAGPMDLASIVPKRNKVSVGVFEDKTEYYDEPAEFRRKVAAVASAIRASSHCIVYTGAGISTSARLPDYRGPRGIWTLTEEGQSPQILASGNDIDPTLGHMAVTALVNNGYVKHVVSTNIDGLHLRSGLAGDQLSELHGNAYAEKCTKCGHQTVRQVTAEVIQNGMKADHLTGTNCPKTDCGAPMRDLVVKFGEPLPESEITRAQQEAEKSDLAIVIGTSMRVKPACDLPLITKRNGGKLIIVNLQKTPFDSDADIRVYAESDDFLMILANELALPVPTVTPDNKELASFFDDVDFRYENWVQRIKEKQAENNEKMKVFGTQKSNNTVLRGEQDRSGVELIDARNLVMFSQCNNCDYTISSKCTKVLIEDCQSVTVRIPNTVLTQTLEVVHCKDVKIEIGTQIFTATVDQSERVEVIFGSSRFFHTFYVADTVDVTLVVVPDLPILLSTKELCERFPASAKTDFPQFVVQFHNGKLITELVVREGGGYATTQRQKDNADERDRRNIQAAARIMGRMITLSGPSSASTSPSSPPM